MFAMLTNQGCGHHSFVLKINKEVKRKAFKRPVIEAEKGTGTHLLCRNVPEYIGMSP